MKAAAGSAVEGVAAQLHSCSAAQLHTCVHGAQKRAETAGELSGKLLHHGINPHPDTKSCSVSSLNFSSEICASGFSLRRK